MYTISRSERGSRGLLWAAAAGSFAAAIAKYKAASEGFEAEGVKRPKLFEKIASCTAKLKVDP